MFRKILICAMFATAAGYCFAADMLPQVVTSEVFYEQTNNFNDAGYRYSNAVAQEYVPAWPLAGSDADVVIGCATGACSKTKQQDNIRVVSKIGSDMVIENDFDVAGFGNFAGWSGGANMLHGTQIPAGFDDECNSSAEMPLLHREVLEDDGANVLAVSRSGRKTCGKYADSYDAFAVKMGMKVEEEETVVTEEETEIAVAVDAEPAAPVMDQVRSWVVANGQTLREVLQSWCDKEGWDLVWATSREYPIEASAVFKGRFVDVASALVRNFGRATPIPYAKFYKGNRVLVVSTNEE